jgi:hypothetical protein
VSDRRKIPANAKAAEPKHQELTGEELEKVTGGDRSATGSALFDEADALFGKTKGVARGDSGNGI